MLNLSTIELSRLRLRLRDDIRVFPEPNSAGVSVHYRIDDPSQGKFYRVGHAEYLLISLLDGHTSFAAAVTLSARKLGREAFREHEAYAIGSWLIDVGLATSSDSLEEATARSQVAKPGFNPLWWKVKLLTPDRLLDRALPWVGWLAHPWLLIPCVMAWIWAATIVASHEQAFLADFRQVFAVDNWLQLGVVWLALKIVHEFAHALTCKRYGGRVSEMGAAFVLLAPLAYVDVTSAWSFSSKWKRIHVSAAGMLCELTLAAGACWLWSTAIDDTERRLWHNVVLSAGVTTVLFNVNPLMRFDGYYILSDLFEIPNLSQQASQEWSRLAGVWLLGRPAPSALPCGWQAGFIRGYGLLAGLWRISVTVTLIMAASVMFAGAGIVLALVAGVGWLVPVIHSVSAAIRSLWRRSPVDTVRRLSLMSLLLIAAYAAVALAPSPVRVTAPAVVEYADLAVVRVETPGFLEAIHVVDGQRVIPGTVLATLRNDDVTQEVRDLELQIAQCQARGKGLLNRREFASAQLEERRARGLREQLLELSQREAALTLRAPAAGRALCRRVETRIGSQLEAGSPLLVIGDERHKELLTSVDQSDVDVFLSQADRTAQVRIEGRRAFRGRFKTSSPQAVDTLPHDALAAPHGGSLEVVSAPSGRDAESPWKLAASRFTLRVGLDEATSRRLRAGERGTVSADWGGRTIAQQLHLATIRWLAQFQVD